MSRENLIPVCVCVFAIFSLKLFSSFSTICDPPELEMELYPHTRRRFPANCDCEGAVGSGEGTRCFRRVEGHTERKQRGILNSHLRRKTAVKVQIANIGDRCLTWFPLEDLMNE